MSGENILVQPENCETVIRNLIHLIRNSIDHGIEPTRGKLAKPNTGTIDLRFSLEKGQLTIIIKDDGRGIDQERLIERAVELGYLERSKSRTITADEVNHLIFKEGFSTKSTKNSISGQGLGMSIIRESVLEKNGMIQVSSKPNQGCKITISIPC